jgi:hypothetical protein
VTGALVFVNFVCAMLRRFCTVQYSAKPDE